MVATALTACGIETTDEIVKSARTFIELQQRLPLAVLKLPRELRAKFKPNVGCNSAYRLRY